MVDLILPPGMTAALIADDGWGRIGVVAKAAFGPDGASLAAAPVLMADRMAGGLIAEEGEVALFKPAVDLHVLGHGFNGPWIGWIDEARIDIDGVQEARFLRGAQPDQPDTVNLFGYEPRPRRAAIPAGFVFAQHAGLFFRASRRSDGYTPGVRAALPATFTASVRTRRAAEWTPLMARPLALPPLTLLSHLHVAGPDRAAWWCAQGAAAMAADTLILTDAGATVLWRGSFPLTTHPLARLRRLTVRET